MTDVEALGDRAALQVGIVEQCGNSSELGVGVVAESLEYGEAVVVVGSPTLAHILLEQVGQSQSCTGIVDALGSILAYVVHVLDIVVLTVP